MKKFTIISVISVLVGMAQSACWSSELGYDCCEYCKVYYTDNDGKWGVENRQWCGIDESKCDGSCWAYQSKF